MNTAKWGVMVVAGAALGGAIGYGLATRGGHEPSAVSMSAAVGDTRKILYYHDPMKPEVRFDKPGKSPFMNMQLVPVYADAGAGADSAAGAVAISANTQQNLGIRIGRVEKAVIAAPVMAVGAVAYDERVAAVVQTRVAGYVAHLAVRAAQDRVRRGQVLAEIIVPAWIEAEGEYLALLRAESTSSAALREAARQRLLVLGVPEVTIATLEKSRSLPTSANLRAPIDGVVTELGLREGANFEAGALLFRINGIASVWVNAQLPEAQASGVASGVHVQLRATAFPGETFNGRVLAILPQVDATTRTVGVRVAVDNAAGRLSPGMFVQTSLAPATAVAQLWVPSEAVIATGERTVVIVKAGDHAFDVVNVTLGTETDGKTAVLAGLAEGQLVVISGQFLIDSEASLRATLNRLSSVSPGPAP
jgi:Cu(I)/Ag(I) efflux system membrane fusion protein